MTLRVSKSPNLFFERFIDMQIFLSWRFPRVFRLLNVIKSRHDAPPPRLLQAWRAPSKRNPTGGNCRPADRQGLIDNIDGEASAPGHHNVCNFRHATPRKYKHLENHSLEDLISEVESNSFVSLWRRNVLPLATDVFWYRVTPKDPSLGLSSINSEIKTAPELNWLVVKMAGIQLGGTKANFTRGSGDCSWMPFKCNKPQCRFLVYAIDF